MSKDRSQKTATRPRLQIIRGLPGSGKTTLALKNFSHLMRIETDMYFSRGGKYVFTLDLNNRAVKWFNKTIEQFAKAQMDFVVTGVFAAHTERLEKTIQSGLDNGYDVYVKTLRSDFGNVHKVPEAHLKAMRDCFVEEKELKAKYKGVSTIHFGLMSSKLKV